MKLNKLKISKSNVLELADSIEEIPSNRTQEIAGGVWETGRGPCDDMPTTRCNTETGGAEGDDPDRSITIMTCGMACIMTVFPC